MTAPVLEQRWPFDAAPLTEPVDRAAAREYAREMRRQGRVPTATTSTVVGWIVLGIVLAVMIPVFLTVTAGVFVAFSRTGFSLLALVPLLFFGAAIAAVVVAVVRQVGSRAVRWWRLDRFARANGMTFAPSLTAPPLPGMIFSLGHSRIASDLVRGAQPRFVEFGNYRYTTGSGKNQSTHRWGYVAVRLDVPLPNIVLDATANDALFGSNLPTLLDRDQRLSLEGDFDRSFTLYCPRGYERDALYLFTPDIMARFIDNAAVLDVEIVDDWLFLYSPRALSTLDPATWAWLFATVHALLDKLAQWGRWRDDRLLSDAAAAPYLPGAPVPAGAAGTAMPFAAPTGVLRPPPGVAAPGRRLTKRFPWVAIVVVAAFFLVGLLLQSGLLGLFLGR